jgi:hypothetical protein
MGVRIGGYADGIRLGFFESFEEVAKFRIPAAEFLVQFGPRFRGAGDEAYNFEVVHLVVSEGVGAAHISGSGAENFKCLCHGSIVF